MLERSTCGLLHTPTDMAPWHTIAASMGTTVPLDLSHDALSLQSRLEMLCSALWCVVLPGENLCCWVIAPASLMGWACKESTGAMAHSWLAQAEQA